MTQAESHEKLAALRPSRYREARSLLGDLLAKGPMRIGTRFGRKRLRASMDLFDCQLATAGPVTALTHTGHRLARLLARPASPPEIHKPPATVPVERELNTVDVLEAQRRFRQVFLATVTEADHRVIVQKLVAMAQAGDVQAARLIFQYQPDATAAFIQEDES